MFNILPFPRLPSVFSLSSLPLLKIVKAHPYLFVVFVLCFYTRSQVALEYCVAKDDPKLLILPLLTMYCDFRYLLMQISMHPWERKPGFWVW